MSKHPQGGESTPIPAFWQAPERRETEDAGGMSDADTIDYIVCTIDRTLNHPRLWNDPAFIAKVLPVVHEYHFARAAELAGQAGEVM